MTRVLFFDDVTSLFDCPQAKGNTADDAAAPAAKCKNFRRASFSIKPSQKLLFQRWLSPSPSPVCRATGAAASPSVGPHKGVADSLAGARDSVRDEAKAAFRAAAEERT
jgi:hypothetical protein